MAIVGNMLPPWTVIMETPTLAVRNKYIVIAVVVIKKSQKKILDTDRTICYSMRRVIRVIKNMI